MGRTSYKLITVWGIPIKIHISLLLMVLILALQLGLVSGVLLALGLAASIVLHELGHSIVAIKKGCRVREITLLCIGGTARMERIPTKPLDEFLMAIAGPAVSLALGLGFLAVGSRLPLPFAQPYPLNIVQLVGLTNIGLLIFNLLPSFPMDGGRVLRSALTPKMGRLRATFIAARLGRVMAVLFGIYGFFASNLILIFIAFFIFIAAGNEYRIVRMQEAAKQAGHDTDTWPPFETPAQNDADRDTVTIGPPPYEEGPGSQSEIRSSEPTDSARNLFDRWRS